MSSAHGGRRRPLARTTSSSEDQALNQIAREAEARLAAKRAARAEARSIRLKELERQQQEGGNGDDDIDSSVNDEPPVPPTRHSKKGSLSRSVSAGATGLTVDPKEQTSVDMNGPVVPEKLLKNIQVRQSLAGRGQCVSVERLVEEEEISSEVKAEFKEKTKENNKLEKAIKGHEEEIQRLKEAIEFRDNFLAERGLSLYEELEVKEDDGGTSPTSLRDAVSLAVPDDTDGSSELPRSRSNSRRPSLTDEKDTLILQIKNLQAEVLSLKREESDTPKAITADLEELRREFSRQVNDFKIRQQKAEQDNARLEGLVSRLRDCQSNTTR
ncbi:PREDICTED: leucine-rich repeat flightless-interacting protein 2-like [Acropora digitifera]|uniref:leucine-rich repeat flightless-interacting protein 2-like n=1 Tax=Acropora digitifera TaxID=70779 RepID=UPI00077B24FE|nr:PREDICTED: leucine-rich repeat flightless-interacting protein 2-like [Acropora digitifera]